MVNFFLPILLMHNLQRTVLVNSQTSENLKLLVILWDLTSLS